MTARDKLTEYAASWIADCGESYDTADAQAAQLVAEHRAEVAEEFAVALLAVDPVEWALAGQHAGTDAAKLIRRLACTSAPDTPCFVCTHPRGEHGDGQLDAMCQVDQCFCRT